MISGYAHGLTEDPTVGTTQIARRFFPTGPFAWIGEPPAQRATVPMAVALVGGIAPILFGLFLARHSLIRMLRRAS